MSSSLPQRIFLVLSNRHNEPGPEPLHPKLYAFREVRPELADDVLLTLQNECEVDVPAGLHVQAVAIDHNDRKLGTFEVSCQASTRSWVDPADADVWERGRSKRPHDEVLRVLALQAELAEQEALRRLPQHDDRRFGIPGQVPVESAFGTGLRYCGTSTSALRRSSAAPLTGHRSGIVGSSTPRDKP